MLNKPTCSPIPRRCGVSVWTPQLVFASSLTQSQSTHALTAWSGDVPDFPPTIHRPPRWSGLVIQNMPMPVVNRMSPLGILLLAVQEVTPPLHAIVAPPVGLGLGPPHVTPTVWTAVPGTSVPFRTGQENRTAKFTFMTTSCGPKLPSVSTTK
jgi:hypothetical protein